MGIRQLMFDICELWPEHRRFLDAALLQIHEIKGSDELAQLVMKVAGNRLPEIVDGYRWMCSMMLEEELVFRRTGSYRYSTFSEVDALVYSNAPIMAAYLDGLLLSQAIWPNHVRAIELFRNSYLPLVRDARHHLEIGPGHGLLLYFAAKQLAGFVEGWDISSSSIASTWSCLKALGADSNQFSMKKIDFLDAKPDESFDSIVCSEVLEHLENPLLALSKIAKMLSSNGRGYLNIPLNSPSIDHIYLFRSPDEIVGMVTSAGLRVEKIACFPAMGYSLSRAMNARTTVTCSLVVRLV